MIVEEKLEWQDGHWVRLDEHCVWPHADTFEGFVTQMGTTGFLVSDAPELDGRILDQDGGRPFRLFPLDDRGSDGLGVSATYGLCWKNPDWCRLAPGTVLPPLGEVITFRPSTAKAIPDFSQPPALRPTSGRVSHSESAEGTLSGPYTPAEYQRQQAVASGAGRRSRKARRKPRI